MRLSVIIVSFNTRELLRRCLESLGQDHEVIVVDNASSDGSADMVRADFPRVTLISNDKNVGFGTANNQGFDAMTGDLALLLNSDAFATPGAIDRLLEVMQDGSIVACGGRLVNPDSLWVFDHETYVQHLTEGRGMPVDRSQLPSMQRIAQIASTQNSCSNELTLWAVFCEQTLLEKFFRNSKLFSPYWETRRILSQPVTRHPSPVTQVMGACLMMRPVERFDERFFLYCEDTELCKRLNRHGKIVYVPDAVFGHELGASSETTRWESVARYNRGKELYFKIHKGPLASFVCWKLDRAGAFWRMAAWWLASLFSLYLSGAVRRKAKLFARVLFAPIAGPPDPRNSRT